MILMLLSVSVGLLFAADSIFSSFTASSNGTYVTVEWRTITENGLARFEIERSNSGSSYVKIADESAKGYSSTYKYVDSDALMKPAETDTEKFAEKVLSKNNYSYRLRAVYSNGSSSYTDEVKVSHNINSVRRTWGMIKEMFR